MAADVAAAADPAGPPASTEGPKPKGKKATTLSSSATLSFFRSALQDAEAEVAASKPRDAGTEEVEKSQPSTTPKRQRAPGARWDGKASSASQQEWRESKWSLQAAYQRTMRQSPSYSCRGMIKGGPQSKSASTVPVPEVVLNVERSFNYVQKTSPVATFGFGLASNGFQREQDLPPGPIYPIKSPMDSTPHPLYKNAAKSKFGTETLPMIDQVSPGPGTYSLDKFWANSRHSAPRKYTIQGKTIRDFENPPADFGGIKMSGPSPGAYQVAGMRPQGPFKSVKWTIPNAGGRTDRTVKGTDGSGPGAYEISANISRCGSLSSPSWSMQGTNPAVWRRGE